MSRVQNLPNMDVTALLCVLLLLSAVRVIGKACRFCNSGLKQEGNYLKKSLVDVLVLFPLLSIFY